MKKSLIISVFLVVLGNNLAYSQEATEAKKVNKSEVIENFNIDKKLLIKKMLELQSLLESYSTSISLKGYFLAKDFLIEFWIASITTCLLTFFSLDKVSTALLIFIYSPV